MKIYKKRRKCNKTLILRSIASLTQPKKKNDEQSTDNNITFSLVVLNGISCTVNVILLTKKKKQKRMCKSKNFTLKFIVNIVYAFSKCEFLLFYLFGSY